MQNINKKILIVEDEEPLLAALKDEFEGEGFSVVTATDGKQAIELVDKEKPDIMLADIAMPTMDGVTMAQQLKSQNKNIPIIFLTNLDDVEHLSKVIDLGPFDYLVKSNWKLEAIVKRVKEKLHLAT